MQSNLVRDVRTPEPCDLFEDLSVSVDLIKGNKGHGTIDDIDPESAKSKFLHRIELYIKFDGSIFSVEIRTHILVM